MIKILHFPGSIQITLTPNRSLTWRQTFIVMCAFGSFCLSIALVWTFVGAWLILPFAGLEVGLLAFVMYMVSKNTYAKQTLLINEQYVSFHSGRKSPAKKILFHRQRLKLITYEVNRSEDVKELYLVAGKMRQRIGQFLNLDDQNKLLITFAKLGIYPKEIKNAVKIPI